jgi:predicted secreted protein
MPGANDEQIKLNVGASTSIQLKGLGTAGYLWNYKIDKNADCITISKDFVTDEKTNQKNMGASADEVFTIKAVKRGSVDINFYQSRSWEKNENPANEKNITIFIQ